MLDLEEIDHLFDLATVLVLFAPRASDPDRLFDKRCVHPEVATGHDVVEHGHPAKERNVLKRAGDPLCGSFVRVHVPPLLAAKHDRSLLRVIHAVDDVQ